MEDNTLTCIRSISQRVQQFGYAHAYTLGEVLEPSHMQGSDTVHHDRWKTSVGAGS